MSNEIIKILKRLEHETGWSEYNKEDIQDVIATITDQKKRITELELLLKGHKATNNQLAQDHRNDVEMIKRLVDRLEISESFMIEKGISHEYAIMIKNRKALEAAKKAGY